MIKAHGRTWRTDARGTTGSTTEWKARANEFVRARCGDWALPSRRAPPTCPARSRSSPAVRPGRAERP
eukprot:6551120-Pyramimonas_sp.AAC.1